MTRDGNWGQPRFVPSYDTYDIDLNDVSDGNLAASLVGLNRHQLVPDADARVQVQDEDGNTYLAVVESVLPNHLMFVRVNWASRRDASPVMGAAIRTANG
jgi:hypothetical protein